MVESPVVPRPYLRAHERRAQLLSAAAVVVGRDGLAGLSVSAVAAEAGVSRQWVYEHFSDPVDLYRALLLDRFAALDDALDAAAHLSGPDRAVLAARQLFALPVADRRILQALVVGQNRPELAAIESELRERILGRWTPAVRAAGHDEISARAIVWAVVNALFGLADQIDGDDLDVDTAVVVLERLATAFVEPFAASPAPPRRRERRGDGRRHNTGASHAH